MRRPHPDDAPEVMDVERDLLQVGRVELRQSAELAVQLPGEA
jgi:hypothetical protein